MVTSRAVVGSSQSRIAGSAGQRDRDHDPLPQPAGQLVRVAAVPPDRFGDADRAEQLEGPLAGRPGG